MKPAQPKQKWSVVNYCAYDRGKECQHYRRLPSLREYVVIAQDAIRVEHYVRQENDQWLLTDITEADSQLQLASIACRLLMRGVYEKVDLVQAKDK